MGRWRRVVAVIGVVASLGGPLRAASEGEVDHLSLAALLVSDGHWDRAEAVLAEVDPAQGGLDLARYHTLRGLVLLNGGHPAEAAEALSAALAAGQADPSARLYLAQAELGAGRPAQAIAALQAGGEAVDALPGAWVLRARAHRQAEAWDAAWAALDQGLARFPEEAELRRLKVYTAIELGLYQEARELGAAWLTLAGGAPEPWLALAEALRRSGDGAGARALLEEARLRFPGEVTLLRLMARTWLDVDHPLTAGAILAEAAAWDPSLAVEAAECFRLGGDLQRALYLNAQVPDGEAKARQRLGLYLEAGEWDRATALTPRLSRLGLLDEDPLRYALAYAHFRAGDGDAAEALLGPISDPQVFTMALTLRQAIEACAATPGGC